MTEIRIETVFVPMRDGVLLATDLYLPPRLPAPVVAVRTPYGRDDDSLVSPFLSFARRGYAVAVQDLRGTATANPRTTTSTSSSPRTATTSSSGSSAQDWCDGFIGSHGGSYVGQVQWPMATHPRMTTIVPEVSGIGVGVKTASLHMLLNTLARTIGHGEEKANMPHWPSSR